ncbi:hypothetical protein D5S18_31145 [Nocardia panacis]|uniref:Uncharacterized protein n=1 Tax=Nocardia panacis TaxID=2340916 RepID=A0A3A4KAF2_9NOCA|nr:hypothetical protein [Nocardia panacis]RJO69126.1 hypothetical protein D5S18_31145 [Nocardia panacis]
MSVLRRVIVLAAALTIPLVALPAANAAPGAADPQPAHSGDIPSQPASTNELIEAYQGAIERLRSFGMNPFLYPTASAFCVGGSTLGLAPALGVAMPGPWPKTTLAIPGLDLTAAKAGQTLFTFVPYGLGPDSANTSGMRVAWVNLGTGRSGIAEMGPLGDIVRAMIPPSVPAEIRPAAEQAIQQFFFAALPVGGVRAVPVDTGSGTVLAAVYGTVDNGGKSCFFLPTVGITAVA